ncbi:MULTISPECIES: putative sugar O-methyltransferase [Methylomonas]|uniref:Sugar O-methyltransferase n=1 Tax=Methylomonas koyamae TaxID=702114 RepID=A0A177NAJ9_9GAMM|nr:putative sugar O-methyltransferase [Methylomonas koyamae]OAI14912.1 hypothetical protein A1355_11590 [Methylomonas koyamae]
MNLEIFKELLDNIQRKGLASDRSINAFWRYQLERLAPCLSDFDSDLSNITSEQIESILQALAYDQERVSQSLNTEMLIDFATNVLPKQQKSFHASLPGEKRDVEHIGGLWFLWRKKLLEEYLSAVREHGLISSMTTIRHWWYYRKLKSFLPHKPIVSILEIGAGSGFFARLLINDNPSLRYFVVDLSEMLLTSSANLTSSFPMLQASLNSVADNSAPGLFFLETTAIEFVSSATIDVALNFNSMMEMNIETRNYYLNQIYRVCSAGALFYNVNRMQRKMSDIGEASYVNNPLTYPYRKEDVVIEWEPDELQQDYRARFGYGAIESFAISSIRRVNLPQ